MIIPPRRDLAVQLDIHVQLVAHTIAYVHSAYKTLHTYISNREQPHLYGFAHTRERKIVFTVQCT